MTEQGSHAAPRLTVCLTFDFDAMSPWVRRTKNPSAISRGEFGAVAIPRILELLATNDIAATFFTPGHTALAYPALMRDIVAAGHEVAHHGWVHENPEELSPDEERAVLVKGIEVLTEVTGARPVGWRSPAWAMSPVSIDLLLEHGFRYDSSLMGNDFSPYYVRRGDRWSADAPYEFGVETDLVELPVYWGLDDFPAFEIVPGRWGGGAAPSAVREIWQGDFDYALARVPGGVYTLTMHPQSIGRGHRMLMLEGLVAHMRAQDGVVFATMAATAGAWRAAHPAGTPA
ncbi:MAG: polysaccharide deacetylase [Mycobacteriales bacterium]|nr:polysaccharide deacetylase [Frankia sp.]